MKASLTELELRKLSATLEAARDALRVLAEYKKGAESKSETQKLADACDHWRDIVESWPRPCNITERN